MVRYLKAVTRLWMKLPWFGRHGIGEHSLITSPQLTTNWGWRTAGFFFLFPGSVLLMKPGIPGWGRLLVGTELVAGLVVIARERWPAQVRQLALAVPFVAALNLTTLNVVSDYRAFPISELVLWHAAGLMWMGLTQPPGALRLAPLLIPIFVLSTPSPWSSSSLFAALLTVVVMTTIAQLVALDLNRGRRAYTRIRQWGRYMTAVAHSSRVSGRRRPFDIHQSTVATTIELGFTGAGVAQVMLPRMKWEWRIWKGHGLDETTTADFPHHLFIMVEHSGVERLRLGTRDLILLRLCTRDDVTDVLVATSADGVDDGQLQALELLGAQTGRGLEILHLAYYDQLTRLPNRSLFRYRLDENLARRQQDPDYAFALLYLDVDRFKAINDLYGHTVGDLFLEELARRLKRCLRGFDYISHKGNPSSSRLGGDEFAVLLPGVARHEDAALVAERIHTLLSEPFRVGGREVTTRPSIGVVLSDARCGNASEMMRDADTAMYYAKGSDQLRWAVFDSAMRLSIDRRLELERSLPQALSNQEISLRYQPIVIPSTGRPVGFEALLRWHHPTLGAIPPTEFIPLAEEMGAISDLTRWVFEEGIRQIAVWNEQWWQTPSLYVTVNLSRKEIGNLELLDQLRAWLKAYDVEPEQVVVEITERMALIDPDQTQAYLRELRALGLRLALDDFGTGHSSLSCLYDLPVQILKLDHQFVAAANNDRALRSLDGFVRMAHALDLKVVAEGVEEVGQHDAVSRFHCDLVQGYLVAPPLEVSQVAEWLAALDRNRAHARPPTPDDSPTRLVSSRS